MTERNSFSEATAACRRGTGMRHHLVATVPESNQKKKGWLSYDGETFEIVESVLALDRLASASQEVHFEEYSTLKCNQMIHANLGFLTLCAGLSPLVCRSLLFQYPSRQPR